MQPADVACFKPLKSFWKNDVFEWRPENPFWQLGKQHFAPILLKASQRLTKNSIIRGFQACGLYPWNSSAIDFSKCLGKNVLQSPAHNSSKTKNESRLKTISYKSLGNLIDYKIIKQLENNSTDHENCQYFQPLTNIYSTLKPI